MFSEVADIALVMTRAIDQQLLKTRMMFTRPHVITYPYRAVAQTLITTVRLREIVVKGLSQKLQKLQNCAARIIT